MEDLNLDRLEPQLKEGKVLCDLEDVYGLSPTRITDKSQTLSDVILTNKPELFNEAVVYDPSISDHSIVKGIMSENAINHLEK